jgi:hypothetical protein
MIKKLNGYSQQQRNIQPHIHIYDTIDHFNRWLARVLQ